MARPLCEACVDSSHGLDVFACEAHVEEFDLELPIGEVVNQSVLLLSLRLLLVVLVGMMALSDAARTSAEAGGSVKAVVLVFFFAAMWSCRNEPQVGAKTVGVGYSS